MKATVLTYLLPIKSPTSDYGPLFKAFYRSEKIAEQANLKYIYLYQIQL